MGLLRKKVKVSAGQRVSVVSGSEVTISSRGKMRVAGPDGGQVFPKKPVSPRALDPNSWRNRARRRWMQIKIGIVAGGIIGAGTALLGKKVVEAGFHPKPPAPTAPAVLRALEKQAADPNAAAKAARKAFTESRQRQANSSAQKPVEPNRPVERAVESNSVSGRTDSRSRAAEPNAPARLRPRALTAAQKADDFLVFRQEQAKKFGVVLTSKAIDKKGPFEPSPLLVETVKSEISGKCRALSSDRIIIYSIIFHESHFNPNAKSHKYARGLGQLREIQVKQLAKLGFTVSNPYDISQSVEGCVRTVNWVWKNLKVNGSRKEFLSLPREKQLHMLFTAYNGGLSRASDLGPDYRSGYSKAVMPIYKKNLKNNPFK